MKRFFCFLSVTVGFGWLLGAQIVGPPYKVFRVSQIIPPADAVAGCNWFTGTNNASAACANDISYINALLATATAANPIDLIFDVSIGIGGAIEMPTAPFVTLEGIGTQSTGVFVLAGSNATAICNKFAGLSANCQGGVQGLTGTPPSQSGSVVIKNLGIQGNRTGGNSSSGDSRCTVLGAGYWCMALAVANISYLEMDNVEIYDSPSFGTNTVNIGRQVYHNNIVITPNLTNGNTDGIHMDGPSGTFEISGLYCATGDDCIAANFPESYAGNMTGGTISNVQYAGALSGFRTYCNNTSYTLGPVVETNLTGFLSNPTGVDVPTLARLGYTNQGAADCIQSVKITNADVVLTHVNNDGPLIDIEDNVGTLDLTNVKWNSPIAAQPFLNFTGASTLSSFTCRQCTIYRSAAGSSAAFCALLPTGATVTTYDSDCQVLNEQGQTYSALGYLIDLQSGAAFTNFIPPVYKPLGPTIFNGAEWGRVTNILGNNGKTYPVKSVSSGCTTTTIAGTEEAWLISGTLSTGACTPVLTFQVPAPVGFSCNASDQATANLFRQQSSTTTTATMTGVSVATDTLTGGCAPR